MMAEMPSAVDGWPLAALDADLIVVTALMTISGAAEPNARNVAPATSSRIFQRWQSVSSATTRCSSHLYIGDLYIGDLYMGDLYIGAAHNYVGARSHTIASARKHSPETTSSSATPPAEPSTPSRQSVVSQHLYIDHLYMDHLYIYR